MDNTAFRQTVRRLLCDHMLGLSVAPLGNFSTPVSERSNPDRLATPYRDGIRLALAYLALFGGLQLAVHLITSSKVPLRPLLIFQIYGAIWAGWATTTTKIAAQALLTAIETDIAPNLSRPVANLIGRELRATYEACRFYIQSWLLGLGCAGAAAYWVSRDLGQSPFSLEIIVWASGWSLLFATSAGVVHIGRFYEVFARHIDLDKERCFALDAAHSSLVLSIASLGRIMLIFWIGIAISISLIFPFALWALPISPVNFLRTGSLFALFDMVVAGFFSIGVGAIVFLQSEASIRRTAASSALAFLRELEDDLGKLTARFPELNAEEWERFGKLEDLREKTVAGSTYQTALTSTLSIFMPFITIAQPIIAHFWKS